MALVAAKLFQTAAIKPTGFNSKPFYPHSAYACKRSERYHGLAERPRRALHVTWILQRPRLPRFTASAAVADDEETDKASLTGEVTVEEVMNPHPVVLTVDTPVKEAVRLFLDKDISGAPVVDQSGKLVGIISESDLIWKGVGAPQDHFIIPPVYIGLADLMLAWRDNAAFEEEVHKILARTVGEAMNSKPISVPPGMSMSDAAAVMVKKKVNRLPVLQDGKVVGVITRHDVLMGLVATNSPFL